jgi:hypothetical protein
MSRLRRPYRVLRQRSLVEPLETRRLLASVTAAVFETDFAPQSLRYQFNEDVSGTLSSDDIWIDGLGNGGLSTTNLPLVYDATTHTARFQLMPGASPQVVPDGRYEAFLSELRVPIGQEHRFGISFLRGDFDADGDVDNLDQSYFIGVLMGGTPRGVGHSASDANFDGAVNNQDITPFSSQFGKVLADVSRLAAPASIATETLSDTSIRVIWTPPDQAIPPNQYVVYRSGDGVNFSTVAGIVSHVGAGLHNFVDTGLAQGTKYWYRVRPLNDGIGLGHTTDKSWSCTTLPAPTNLIIDPDPLTNAATVTWTNNTTAASYLRMSLSYDGVNFAECDPLPASATSAELTDLAWNGELFVRLEAVSAGGVVSAAVVASDFIIPQAPNSPQVAALTTSAAVVDWISYADVEVHGLQWRAAGGSWSPTEEIVPASGPDHTAGKTFHDLDESQAYEFRVADRNSTGWSAWSEPASLKLIAKAPTDLTTSDVTATALSLHWTDQSGSEDGYLVRGRASEGVWRDMMWLGANATSAGIGGLAAGATYEFQVYAYNENGLSAAASTYQALPALLLHETSFASGSSGWGGTTDVAPSGEQYLGPFTGDAATSLTLSGLPSHDFVHVEFDLYTMHNWYGNGDGDPGLGPDTFTVSIAGTSRLHASFSAGEGEFANWQSYPAPFLGTGSSAENVAGHHSSERDRLGWERTTSGERSADYCYRLAFDVPGHVASSLTINLSGSVTQLGSDDDGAWGIDNVRVTATSTVVGVVMGADQFVAGGSPFNVTVFRESARGEDAREIFLTPVGGVTPGEDIAPLPASVTIPAGAAATTFSVVPIGDGTTAEDATLTLLAQAGSGHTPVTPPAPKPETPVEQRNNAAQQVPIKPILFAYYGTFIGNDPSSGHGNRLLDYFVDEDVGPKLGVLPVDRMVFWQSQGEMGRRLLLLSLDADNDRSITQAEANRARIFALGYSWGGVEAWKTAWDVSRFGRRVTTFRLDAGVVIERLVLMDPVFIGSASSARTKGSPMNSKITSVFYQRNHGRGELEVMIRDDVTGVLTPVLDEKLKPKTVPYGATPFFGRFLDRARNFNMQRTDDDMETVVRPWRIPSDTPIYGKLFRRETNHLSIFWVSYDQARSEMLQ